MLLPREGRLLRIFVGETDRHGGLALYDWIIQQARAQGLAGATALRGIEGFGARNRLRTVKIEVLSFDLPIVVEIVDTEEKINAFLPTIDAAIREGLATVERVDFRLFRANAAEESERSDL